MKTLDTADIAQPTERLQRLLVEQGYLYFPKVVPDMVAARAKQDVMSILRGLGAIDGEGDEPRWSGHDLAGIGSHPDVLQKSGIWEAVAADPSVRALFERIFGEPGVALPHTQYQFTWPTKPDPLTKIHQDAFFNPGLPFMTFWVALMDIPEAMGGLQLIPGHHTHLLHRPKSNDFLPPDSFPPDAWARGEYHAGDIVVFPGTTPHTGMPNSTDILRLSFDMRVCPASSQLPLIGRVVAVEGSLVRIESEVGGIETIAIDEDTRVRTNHPHSVPLEEFIGRRVMATRAGGRTMMLRWAI